ncbi:hypothetical protein DPMN_009666 [Dreissena polymorpha]|uniref:Uncharacterized protein n=1 Tax=Dreissena polymorpha TaxID=45954 RepID=A0A9D4N0V3_DREPO|nr:hypothetical protein DPMN_009666 [Dreissena polymorpha]
MSQDDVEALQQIDDDGQCPKRQLIAESDSVKKSPLEVTIQAGSFPQKQSPT